MSAPHFSLTRRADGRQSITVRQALLVWIGGWLAGNLIASSVQVATGHGRNASAAPTWVTVLTALCLWVPMVGGMWALARSVGAPSFRKEFGAVWRPIDVIGLPIGVLSQLVVVRLVYVPLESWWPHTFGRSRVERNARDLYDRAHGFWLLALLVIVVVGAPLVEELVYRGLLQGAFRRRLNDIVAVVGVAAIFALVHFRPVEYPGLFVFGLILGTCAWRTERLAMGFMAHLAFNATGLALVAGALR